MYRQTAGQFTLGYTEKGGAIRICTLDMSIVACEKSKVEQ